MVMCLFVKYYNNRNAHQRSNCINMFNTLPYFSFWLSIVLFGFLLFCLTFYCFVWLSIVLFGFLLFCLVFYCFVWFCACFCFCFFISFFFCVCLFFVFLSFVLFNCLFCFCFYYLYVSSIRGIPFSSRFQALNLT